jgi:hypothetical protein
MTRTDLIELTEAAANASKMLESRNPAVTKLGADLLELVSMEMEHCITKEQSERIEERHRKRMENALRQVQSNKARMKAEGPKLWETLHRRALAPTIKPAVESAFLTKSFPAMLPCGECRKHYLEWISQHPPEFFSRTAYFLWTVDLHNHVNSIKDEPSPKLSHDEAIAIWDT